MAIALCMLVGILTGIFSVSASDQTDLLAAHGMDGTFESLTVGDTVGDTNNSNPGTIVSDAHTGEKALKLEGQNWKYFYINVTAELDQMRGKTYRLSYWYKTTANGTMNIQVWDGQGAKQNKIEEFTATAGAWTQKTLEFTIDDTYFANTADVYRLRVGLQTGSSVGTAYIDDMVLMEVVDDSSSTPESSTPSEPDDPAEPTDLLAARGMDGSFESLNIGEQVGDTNNGIVVSDAHTGEKAIKLTGHDWKYFYCDVTNELDQMRGKTYRLSYWYKADGGMNIQVWDSQAEAHNVKNSFDGTTDDWKEASATFTIDDTFFATSTEKCLLRVGLEVENGTTAYIDDITLYEVTGEEIPETGADSVSLLALMMFITMASASVVIFQKAKRVNR